MPSPPSDGGTHLPSPGTSPSNDAIRRGSSEGGGGDGPGSGDSAIGAAGDSPRNVSRDNGSKGHAKHFPSGSSLGKLEAGLQSDTLAAEDGSSSVKISGLSKEETKSYVDDDDSNHSKLGSNFFAEENRNKKPAIDGRYAEAMPEKKMEIMDARNTKSFSVAGKGPALVIPIRDVSEEAHVVQSSNKEVKQMDFQSQEEMNRRASRLDACRLRHRSPSPIDSKVESKRPGVVCQYFSQGWCVNGKNCRFMHNIDSMDNISQQLGGGVATTIRRYESQNDQGRVHQRERAESPMWRQYNGKNRFSSLQGEELSSSFPSDSQRFLVYKDGPGKYFSPNAEVNYPILGNHLFTEYGSFSVGSSSLTTSSQTYRTSHATSSHATSLEGLVGKKKEFTLNDDASPVLSHQRTPSVDAKSQTASLLPSHRSLSQNAGHCAHNISDRDTKTKFSSDDWEPSEPFRPSYFAAFPHMSFTRSVHDIVCDTSEEHPIGDKQHKVSCPIQGASILVSSHQQVYDDPVLPGTLGPDYNGNTPSIHIHNIFQKRTSEKGVHAHQRDFLANETKHAGSSGAKLKDSLLKEGKPVGLIQVEDVSDQNPVNYSDGASHKEELKIEQDKPSHSYGDDMIDEDMNKESKALKHFRFVLIDFIKDFLRPTWHKGQLSKDAHNSIVKKSVDKVLSTLESHQIPSTKEAIHHYLSMSQPKIAKLVQGYVEKHQRTNSGISVL